MIDSTIMKKTVTLFLFCFFTTLSFAQTWIQPNAVWHYDFWNIAIGGFYRIEYTQDTLLGGMTSQKIEILRYAFGESGPGGPIVQLGAPQAFPPEYTRVSNDTVYRWEDNQYHVLFDFGAQPGDSWIISTNPPSWADPVCGDTSMVQVTAAGTEVINGTSYRYIELESLGNSAVGLDGHFNERFGGPAYLFPWFRTCDSMVIVELDMLSFKCFEDDGFSLYNPSGEDCEYLLTHLGFDDPMGLQLMLTPNPVTDYLEIKGNKVTELQMYATDGSALLKLSSQEGLTGVDLSDLPSGIYHLRLWADGIPVYRRISKR